MIVTFNGPVNQWCFGAKVLGFRCVGVNQPKQVIYVA